AGVIDRILFPLSAIALALAGIAYLIVPGVALGIVDIESTAESEVLLRTEGVALLFRAAIVWGIHDTDAPARRLGPLPLAGYFVLGSVVDLAAFAQGIVGPASVPSAAIRLALGALSLWAAWSGGRRRSA